MSAPILHLAILQKLVFLVNSRLGLVSVARSLWLPFLRTYGDILPSSLTKVLPRVLVFSTSLPVSVSGTGALVSIVTFLGNLNLTISLLVFSMPIAHWLLISGFAY